MAWTKCGFEPEAPIVHQSSLYRGELLGVCTVVETEAIAVRPPAIVLASWAFGEPVGPYYCRTYINTYWRETFRAKYVDDNEKRNDHDGGRYGSSTCVTLSRLKTPFINHLIYATITCVQATTPSVPLLGFLDLPVFFLCALDSFNP